MKKRIVTIALCAVLLSSMLVLTGCGIKDGGIVHDITNAVEQKKSKGNYDVFGCIEKLSAENTLEEMNNIIGFEGTLTSDTDSYKVYKWELTDDTSITSQFHSSTKTATISANFPNSMVSKKADFSKWSEIKSKLNKREEITYKQFVEYVGGVEGTMTQKSSSSITYKWLNSDGGYLSAYFDAKTGKCTMATGRF